jgi:hypothetical protein
MANNNLPTESRITPSDLPPVTSLMERREADVREGRLGATEFTLYAAADKVVDLAMAQAPMGRENRDKFRTEIQDAVDALIDQCRSFYGASR